MRHGILGRLAVPALLACGLWLAGCGNTEADTTLRGADEVPPNTSPAEGTANAELDGDVLEVTGSFVNLSSDLFEVSGSSAHIHRAPSGQNGGILFNLDVVTTDGRNGTFTGRKSLNDDEKEAFEDGELYVNIHTVDLPAGEIRGQLKP